MRICFGLVVIFFFGCAHHLSALERFQETAVTLNDEARWGRLDLASGKVSARYVAKFMAQRAQWNHAVQIAEVEITRMELDPKGEYAVSDVYVGWYKLNTMELCQTQIRQQWRGDDGRFFLQREQVVSGDATLLEKPLVTQNKPQASAKQ